MSNALTRLRALLGTQAAIARALGMTERQVSRIATTGNVPEYMEAIAELLESLPRKYWPDRFLELDK